MTMYHIGQGDLFKRLEDGTVWEVIKEKPLILEEAFSDITPKPTCRPSNITLSTKFSLITGVR